DPGAGAGHGGHHQHRHYGGAIAEFMLPEGFSHQPCDEALVLRRAEEAKQTGLSWLCEIRIRHEGERRLIERVAAGGNLSPPGKKRLRWAVLTTTIVGDCTKGMTTDGFRPHCARRHAAGRQDCRYRH